MIILPKQIRILCGKTENGIECREYNLFYGNFIWPLCEDDILRVLCDYGMDLGHCWRFVSAPAGVASFPLTIVIYDCFGVEKERASTEITLVDAADVEEMSAAVIGDSMTHHGTYTETLAELLPSLRFIGTRNVTGHYNEGRGGWTIQKYLYQSEHYVRGVSPFTFPVNEPAELYYGDWFFWQKGYDNPESDPYVYKGFSIEHIREGQSFIRDGKLYRFSAGKETLIDEAPLFECSYSKYLRRFSLERPQLVSLLFGANEMQKVEFDRTGEVVDNTIRNFELLIASIREACPDCKIVINLPVMGAEQYAWGRRLGCRWTSRQYHLNILRLCEAILKQYDGREDEGYFVSPMLHVIDPVYGFERADEAESSYTDTVRTVQTNWVHPCETGYSMMAGALAGTIAYISTTK